MKRYISVFFMALLAFSIVSCDDSNSKSEFELVGIWVWTKTTVTQYIEKIIVNSDGSMLIGRDTDSSGTYDCWAYFTIHEYNEDDDTFRATCTYTDTESVYESIWSLSTHYFSYSIEADGLFYSNGSGPSYLENSDDFGPYVKQTVE